MPEDRLWTFSLLILSLCVVSAATFSVKRPAEENICGRTKGHRKCCANPSPSPTEFTDGAALQSSAGADRGREQ